MVSDGCEKLIEDFFGVGGQVVIYDANNGTRKARQALAEKFDKQGIHVIILGMSHIELSHRARVTHMLLGCRVCVR